MPTFIIQDHMLETAMTEANKKFSQGAQKLIDKLTEDLEV